MDVGFGLCFNYISYTKLFFFINTNTIILNSKDDGKANIRTQKFIAQNPFFFYLNTRFITAIFYNIFNVIYAYALESRISLILLYCIRFIRFNFRQSSFRSSCSFLVIRLSFDSLRFYSFHRLILYYIATKSPNLWFGRKKTKRYDKKRNFK